MSWRELWSKTCLGSKLDARVSPAGDRISVGITNTLSHIGVSNDMSLAEARTLAFALLQACHEVYPGGGNIHTSEEAAIVAAQLASEATAELLRYAREGDATNRTVFADEVCGKLAGALDRALMVEGGPIFDAKSQPEEFANELTRRTVLAEAVRFFNEFERPER